MDSCDIVSSTSQTAVMDILVETSSITYSLAEDQNLHEERGDHVRRRVQQSDSVWEGESDDGSSVDGSSNNENSGDESSDDGYSDAEEDSGSHSRCSGRITVSALDEPAKRSDYHQTLVATSSMKSTKAMKDDRWGFSQLLVSETSSNVDGNSDYGNYTDKSSYGRDADTQSSRLVKSRLASDVRHPCETRTMSTPKLAHIQMDSVITKLVFYTIKKAKVSTSGIDPDSIIKNLLEKAKQQISPNKKSVTKVQNVEKIHKAVFKEVAKKIGSAKEILKVMETQEADCVLIDVLRIHLTSPKNNGCFPRLFSSIGKFFGCKHGGGSSV